jgi:hypothetical protein
LDEIPKPVVVALLKASHADDHRPLAHAAQRVEAMRGVRRAEVVRRDDNSRRKMQNVRGDSLAASRTERSHQLSVSGIRLAVQCMPLARLE